MKLANKGRRNKKDKGEEIMNSVRAARGILGDRTDQKDLELAAFMAIFHPDFKFEKEEKK
jgi:hypothetical protein